MRSEKEMFDLIINTAKDDKRIRGVILNGSRANPNVKKDIFQDYDILYVVEETKSFRDDKDWINRFGEQLYMQYPEENTSYPSDIENNYGWLIQFTDGNRLDLHVCRLEYSLKAISEDKLCKVLLDKDKYLLNIQESTDKDYWVKRPTAKEFLDTCNEYWWCLNNVAKGLWREEIPYVMDMLNYNVRPMLVRLLEWKIGFATSFTVSVGKSGKYMYKWLDQEEWNTFLKTYPSGKVKEIWESVFTMCNLFDDIANEIAPKINVTYNQLEANNSLKFLKDVNLLPKDAKEIY